MAKITTSLLKELEKKVAIGEISYSKMVEILNNQLILNQGSDFEFYKIKSDMASWRGQRFFKFKNDSKDVLQVCLEINNDIKKGKGHYVGVYKISRVTFFSNWFPNYIESSSESEFNEAFERAIKILSNGTI